MNHLITPMSVNTPLSTSHISTWAQRVLDQCEKMCGDPIFKEPKIKEILKFLVNNELKESPEEVGQEAIYKAFFSSKGDKSIVGHKMKSLRTALSLYAAKHPTDDIFIDCPLGAHKLKIEERNIGTATGKIINSPPGADSLAAWLIKNSEEHIYRELKNDAGGLLYEVRQMDKLSCFLETHTRHKRNYRHYDDKTLAEYENSLRSFLTKSSHNTYILLIGRSIEKRYVDAILRAAKGYESQVRCYELPFAGVLMNFDILQYADNRSEVIFGWGEYNLANRGERLFLASDTGLVEEFAKYYDFLTKISAEIPLSQLAYRTEDDTTKDIDCYFVGNSATALKRVIEKMPRLLSLLDVHTRPEEGNYKPYGKALTDAFRDGLKDFLRREGTHLSLIIGRSIEERYVEAMVAATEGRENGVAFHRLRQPGFLMNFAIFEYEGAPGEQSHREVLFGWGHYTHRSEDAVFLSADPKLVKEFENYYAKLLALSDAVPITEILAPPDNATLFPIWDQEKVYRLLKKTKKGTEVCIFTTVFFDYRIMFDVMQEQLERGVHFKVVLMDHTSEVFQTRFKRRKKFPPSEAKKQIEKQLEELERMRVELEQERGHKSDLYVKHTKMSGHNYSICGNA